MLCFLVRQFLLQYIDLCLQVEAVLLLLFLAALEVLGLELDILQLLLHHSDLLVIFLAFLFELVILHSKKEVRSEVSNFSSIVCFITYLSFEFRLRAHLL